MKRDVGENLKRAIQEDPTDATVRYIYADWLEEVGRVEEAEELRKYIQRQQCPICKKMMSQYLINRSKWNSYYCCRCDYRRYEHHANWFRTYPLLIQETAWIGTVVASLKATASETEKQAYRQKVNQLIEAARTSRGCTR